MKKNRMPLILYSFVKGNDMLHRLTSLKPQELRVDIERFNGEKAYAVYLSFSCVSIFEHADCFIMIYYNRGSLALPVT